MPGQKGAAPRRAAAATGCCSGGGLRSCKWRRRAAAFGAFWAILGKFWPRLCVFFEAFFGCYDPVLEEPSLTPWLGSVCKGPVCLH